MLGIGVKVVLQDLLQQMVPLGNAALKENTVYKVSNPTLYPTLTLEVISLH